RVALPDRIELGVVRGQAEEAGEHSRIARKYCNDGAVIVVDPSIGVAVVREAAGVPEQLIEDRTAYFGDRGSEILKVPVEEAVGHAGPGGHILDAQAPKAELVQGIARGAFQQLAASQSARLQRFRRLHGCAPRSGRRTIQTSCRHPIRVSAGRASAAMSRSVS